MERHFVSCLRLDEDSVVTHSNRRTGGHRDIKVETHSFTGKETRDTHEKTDPNSYMHKHTCANTHILPVTDTSA